MQPDRRQLNQHAARLLKTHQTLLKDQIRNEAFYEALKQTVTRESTVLDIGSGTGIWAIAAAMLGAKRVVAIDADPMLAELIKKLAADKGLSGQIEVICGYSMNVDLPPEFDIVVSETIGYLGYDEDIVPIMADARLRFLRPGGIIIPENISLHACLGRFDDRSSRLPNGIDIDLDGFCDLDLNRPRVLKDASGFEMLSSSKCLIETDLRKSELTPDLTKLNTTWEGATISDANAICLWVRSKIVEDIVLDTRQTSSWYPNIFRLGYPIGVCESVNVEISLSPENSAWSAVPGNGSPRSFSLDAVASFLMPAGELNRLLSIKLADEADLPFRKILFAASRREPLISVGWTDEMVGPFLESQFALRERSYRAQYANVAFSIISRDGKLVGGIIVDRSPGVITLVDIEILPEHQRQGIATYVIDGLKDEGTSSIRLHVAKGNENAFRLYKKLGFDVVDDESGHIEMTWSPQE